MSMIAGALARSGTLGAGALASIVAVEGLSSPAVATHPLVVRSPAAGPLPMVLMDRVVELDPPAPVLEELLALTPPQVVASLAAREPRPELVRALGAMVASGAAAGEGREDPRWVLLRVCDLGEPAVREGLVLALADEVGLASRPGDVVTWLAAAVSCPHLLPALVDMVRPLLRAPVARFAAIAAAGGSPVEVFAAELCPGPVAAGNPGADWRAAVRAEPAMTWEYVIWCTGLETVAERALRTTGAGARPPVRDVRVWSQVLHHPHLVGGPAYMQARARLVQTLGGGPVSDAVVVDRARVVAPSNVHELMPWLAAGRGGVDDVTFAWGRLRQLLEDAPLADALGETEAGVVAAAQLACMDTPDGVVWPAALAWARQGAARVQLNEQNAAVFAVLEQVSDVVHAGASLGPVRVVDLYGAWVRLWRPSWLERVLGQFLASVPGVGSPAFVQALVTFGAGEAFEGTFDDLVAVATAVAG